MPDWVPVLPAPWPEPTPPVPGTAPELPMLVLLPLELGLGEVPDEDEVPPALEPVVMPSSLRHFSRSEPIMPRHLLLELEVPLLPDTPEELVPGVDGLPVVPALLPVPPYVDPVP